jgi:hypothetical protein
MGRTMSNVLRTPVMLRISYQDYYRGIREEWEGFLTTYLRFLLVQHFCASQERMLRQAALDLHNWKRISSD